MANYYVSSTGNDADDGLSSGTAWLTIAYALTQIVSGDTLAVAAGTYSTSGLVPSSPQTIFATGTIYNGVIPASGCKVYYRMACPPTGDGFAYSGETQIAIADDSGQIRVELWQNAEYEFWAGRGEHKQLLTGTTDCNIPQLISAESANP